MALLSVTNILSWAKMAIKADTNKKWLAGPLTFEYRKELTKATYTCTTVTLTYNLGFFLKLVFNITTLNNIDKYDGKLILKYILNGLLI